MTREQLALAHHVWHCAAPDEELCTPDDTDFDFADYALKVT